ncbi:MAG: response regulator [Syntrophorhabdales bacterium]|jgi:DNA-binding NtrC family response regulator
MNERILLVDDEETTLAVIGELLELMGYRVEATTDGQEALAAFVREPERFDIVISDVSMGRMSGLTLAESVLQTRPGMPVLILTGDEAQARKEAAGLGISSFVQKPVSIDRLVDTIGRALSCPTP